MQIQNRTFRSHSRRSRHDPFGRREACTCVEARAQRRRTIQHKIDVFKIPEPLSIDQNEICMALERAALSGGRTGRAAARLRKDLQPHLLKEEEDLLQILGLLLPLAHGEVSPAMQDVPVKTERLKSRMFEMAREHAAIIESAHKLLRAARLEKKLALVGFTERLMLRAWTDEVVFYPAAILIGEYLKLRFGQRARPI